MRAIEYIFLLSIILVTNSCGFGDKEFLVPGTSVRVNIPADWKNFDDVTSDGAFSTALQSMDGYTYYGFFNQEALDHGFLELIFFSTIDANIDEQGIEVLTSAHVVKNSQLADVIDVVEGDCPTLPISGSVGCFTVNFRVDGRMTIQHQYFMSDSDRLVSIRVISNTYDYKQLNEILNSVRRNI